jgi:putative zinc finger protein
MNDQWTDRLSEYVDGELAAAERTALEAHLATCADCRATLEDLRKVVVRARSIHDRAPKADLWPGVAKRIGAGKVVDIRSRRFSFNVPQLIAASIALVVLSAGGMWVALNQPQPIAGGGQFTQEPGPRTAVVSTGRTDAAIAELQDALTRNESRLDTSTVRVVRENLALIDRAITQARRALDKDPANVYLNLHLADTMRRKLELLRRVNAIATAQS